MKMNFTVLVEEDYASRNFCAYIPELRVSAVGETEEEVLGCLKDLIAIEVETSPKLKTFSSKVLNIQVDIEKGAQTFHPVCQNSTKAV
jgi:predicted RNase H-like HicB family nuclease